MEKILDERFWSKPADGKRIKYVKTQSSKNRRTGCVCGRCCKEKIMKSIYSWLSSQSLEFNIDKDIKSVGVFNVHIESSNTLIDYNDRSYFTKGNRSIEQFKRFQRANRSKVLRALKAGYKVILIDYTQSSRANIESHLSTAMTAKPFLYYSSNIYERLW